MGFTPSDVDEVYIQFGRFLMVALAGDRFREVIRLDLNKYIGWHDGKGYLINCFVSNCMEINLMPLSLFWQVLSSGTAVATTNIAILPISAGKVTYQRCKLKCTSLQRVIH